MKFPVKIVSSLFMAASLAGVAAPGFAAPQDPCADRPPLHEMMPGDGAPFEEMAFGPLRHLRLSEAQQDSVFAILHEQAPVIRSKTKAIHKAQEKLAQLAESERWDASAAKTQTDLIAKETAELALLQTHTRQKLFAVLTPEQRKQWQAKSELPQESARRGMPGPRNRN